ncbi:hypothetical protein Glove_438g29 [Diversispora epigaea]|uniref:Prolyl 4-hydroxylase alpha subunit domain-containing protein n=1 Tax=Diversispora epigaea TaxID=1348612 RepID=A0A397GVL9_9GLOM|nr:hypothetical protein Glove_438g29 [Diversispora epigaea]
MKQFKSWFNDNNYLSNNIKRSVFKNLLKKKWNVLLKDFSFKIEDGFIKIENDLTVSELELKNSAKLKYYRLTRQNNSLAFKNIDDKNALFQATEAVNKYYFHLMDDKAHRSKDFCKNRVEHFDAYRRFTSFPYTSVNTASDHNLAHRPCVDNLLFNNYENMYLKLRNFSWGSFAPKPFEIFLMIAINFNALSNYYWDKLDASNCLCCLVPLGNFQGGELYFPQLHTLIPLQTGQVVAFSSHYLLHDNFPLVNRIRHSVVYFVHNILFQEEDNLNNMEIDNAELNLELKTNRGLNSKTPTFTKPRKFQTKDDDDDYNNINQRRASYNYYWDKLDASNCLCCLVPLGNFQGGELYFPQLHTLIPLQTGQVVAFSSHYLLHDNFPLVNRIRHSVVYFVHNILFQEEDNLNNMEIDNAELNLELKTNRGLNSKTPTFTKPRKFQTKDDDDDYNNINQRRAS